MKPISLALIALAAVAAGCSQGRSLPPEVPATASLPQSTMARAEAALASATPKPLLYASQFYGNDVLVYDQTGSNQAPVRTITAGLNGPWGMWVAKNHDLYVANNNALTNIVVYHRNASTPYKTLSVPAGYYPWQVVVDSAGTVFATNNPNSGSGGILTEYAGGSTTPTSTLTVPANTTLAAPRIDHKGNLWLNYFQNGTAYVVRYSGESGTPTTTQVVVGNGRGFFFNGKNALVMNDSRVPQVTVWPSPYADPSETCAEPGGAGGPWGIARNAANSGYYVADAADGEIAEYLYAGCASADTITHSITTANPAYMVATDPD